MLPDTRKTALMFHAKDDLAEVRCEVYRVSMKRKTPRPSARLAFACFVRTWLRANEQLLLQYWAVGFHAIAGQALAPSGQVKWL
jgi:hypothetical protein